MGCKIFVWGKINYILVFYLPLVRMQYKVMFNLFNQYRMMWEMTVVVGVGVLSSAVYAPLIIPKEGRLPRKPGNGLRRNLGLGG